MKCAYGQSCQRYGNAVYIGLLAVSGTNHGGYGEGVITAGCGPVIMGSNPISHPNNIRSRKGSDFVIG